VQIGFWIAVWKILILLYGFEGQSLILLTADLLPWILVTTYRRNSQPAGCPSWVELGC
jgi:hypothetical protein